MTQEPAYLESIRTGRLREVSVALREGLASCRLCPRRCGVDRLRDERGFCRTGRVAEVSSYGAHFGEEDPLVGRGGSGTVFFTHCNLRCCFCQNYEISHGGAGSPVDAEGLARIMLGLQARGCHNINLVSPSHVIPQILEALVVAVEGGLRLPLVYNSGGYDAVESLKRLEGTVDIYMPDFKFTNPDVARDLAEAPDYPVVAREALQEMHRQVGDLVLDDDGIALGGLLVRHLVLPGGLAGTPEVVQWIAENLSTGTYLNLMDQFRPCGTSFSLEELRRGLSPDAVREAVQAARAAGLHRLDRPRLRRLPSL